MGCKFDDNCLEMRLYYVIIATTKTAIGKHRMVIATFYALSCRLNNEIQLKGKNEYRTIAPLRSTGENCQRILSPINEVIYQRFGGYVQLLMLFHSVNSDIS